MQIIQRQNVYVLKTQSSYRVTLTSELIRLGYKKGEIDVMVIEEDDGSRYIKIILPDSDEKRNNKILKTATKKISKD